MINIMKRKKNSKEWILRYNTERNLKKLNNNNRDTLKKVMGEFQYYTSPIVMEKCINDELDDEKKIL